MQRVAETVLSGKGWGYFLIAFCVVIPSLYQSQAHRHSAIRSGAGWRDGELFGRAAPYSPFFLNYTVLKDLRARGPSLPPPAPQSPSILALATLNLGWWWGRGGEYTHAPSTHTSTSTAHAHFPPIPSHYLLSKFFPLICKLKPHNLT